jgi:hypothetical protein
MKVVQISVLVLASVAISSCSRSDDAKTISEKLVDKVNAGECSNATGLPASASANWSAFCQDISKYLPAGAKLPALQTQESDSGEIGKSNSSSVSFTNVFGATQTLFVSYEGTGMLANKPVLQSVMSLVAVNLHGEQVNRYGLGVSGSPAPEVTKLADDVRRLLSEQKCGQLAKKAKQPLKSTNSTFEKACASLNASLKVKNVDPNVPATFDTVQYSVHDLYGPDVPAAGVDGILRTANEDVQTYASRVREQTKNTHKLVTVSSPELSIELILSDGTWYLNRVGFSRVLFQYKL